MVHASNKPRHRHLKLHQLPPLQRTLVRHRRSTPQITLRPKRPYQLPQHKHVAHVPHIVHAVQGVEDTDPLLVLIATRVAAAAAATDFARQDEERPGTRSEVEGLEDVEGLVDVGCACGGVLGGGGGRRGGGGGSGAGVGDYAEEVEEGGEAVPFCCSEDAFSAAGVDADVWGCCPVGAAVVDGGWWEELFGGRETLFEGLEAGLEGLAFSERGLVCADGGAEGVDPVDDLENF